MSMCQLQACLNSVTRTSRQLAVEENWIIDNSRWTLPVRQGEMHDGALNGQQLWFYHRRRRLADAGQNRSYPVRRGLRPKVQGANSRPKASFVRLFGCDGEHQRIGSGSGRLDEPRFKALARASPAKRTNCRHQMVRFIRWRTLEELCYI